MTARASPLPDRDPAAPPTIGNAAKIAGWGVVFWGAVQLASALLERNATAMVAVQAALAEWGAGRLGIAWSDPQAPPPSAPRILARVGRGALLGAATGALVVAFAIAGGATVRGTAGPAGAALGVGLLVAVLAAVRDELLLRGVVLGVTRGHLPAWGALAACAAVAGAARLGATAAGAGSGVGAAVVVAVAVDALRGAALGALWLRDRGAWMACGANAACGWTLDAVARGGLVDVTFPVEPSAGVPALLATAAAALGACIWALRGASTRRMEAERPAGLR